MTGLTPTGELMRTPSGADVVLTRRYPAPIADVWASVTESERTERWFGPWRGDPGPGRTIQVKMSFEESAPWIDVVIESCTPPSHLCVVLGDEHGPWRLELDLSETDGSTTLRLTDHRPTTEGIGDYACGWEYYLDALTASRDGLATPSFDVYFAELKPPYDEMGERAVQLG